MSNIIYIMADQLGAAFLGSYGSGVASSPNLDALADAGCRFTRYYAHCPVCAPNRATMYTGRSVEVHGMTTNNLHLDRSFPTYVELLKDQGYTTGGFGKFHLSPMQQPLPEDFSFLGYDESVPTEDPKLGPWLDWVRREHPDQYQKALSVSWPMPYCSCYGSEAEDLTEPMRKAREEYLKPAQEASPWHHMYSSPLPAEVHQTTYITDLAVDFITRNADNPFFCHISYVDPHDPYDPPAPYDTMFDPEAMKGPISKAVESYKTDTLNDVLDFAGFTAIADDPAALKKLRALYHGSIRFIDDQVGRVLQRLEELGIADDTIIVFTTDHGDMMGDHGFMTKGVKHYDAAIRCPLIIAGKGIERGKEIPYLCSSLDIYPTLTDLAACPELPPVEGTSLLPACSDESLTGHDVRVQSPYNGEGHVETIITTEGLRLSLYEDGELQLFDLRTDPQEQHDLSEDPSHAPEVADLLRRLNLRRFPVGYPQHYGVLPIEDGQRKQVLDDIAGPMSPTWNSERTPRDKRNT